MYVYCNYDLTNSNLDFFSVRAEIRPRKNCNMVCIMVVYKLNNSKKNKLYTYV